MSKSGVKLSAKWQLDAALLSRPVDLTPLVTMSRSNPESFLDDNTLHRLVTSLLNEKNDKKSDKDTKLDVLNILANVAIGSKRCNAEVRTALQGVSEWFDEYISIEEAASVEEPELHKAMVLLLARCWEYRLKTEDVLELTQGNRKIALCTVVGLLEDGETYSTELRQRQKPGQGKMGQWEHELVCHRYEKPLMLQVCRLLRGFTHPGTYFDSSTINSQEEFALYRVEKFADEMDTLLEITLRSSLVEKLSLALYDCLFEESSASFEEESKSEVYGSLEEYDHIAVASVHAFLQNLYFYAETNTEEYRRHLLMETLLIPRLVLPYLDRCVIHATILNTRAEAYRDMLEGDSAAAEMALHNPNLISGMAASLRTLIIASFRAPQTQFVMTLLRRLNPTQQLLRASAFCKYHDYIFALICMLNVNMGALDLGKGDSDDDNYATTLLSELSYIYNSMDRTKQQRVMKRLASSGALPLSRDTPSYVAVMSVMEGGSAGQFSYASSHASDNSGTAMFSSTLGAVEEASDFRNSRAEAKRQHLERMSHLRQNDSSNIPTAAMIDSAEPKVSAFQIAVSVANAADSKDAKPLEMKPQSESNKTAQKFRLLGDLPAFGKQSATDKDANAIVDKALNVQLQQPHKFNIPASAQSESKMKDNVEGVPKAFLCAINGHVMKDPVRCKSTGLVFERATIELWLQSRGAVCPITNTYLDKNDLIPDDELRNQIKRYHIQQVTSKSSNNDEDLYDF